MSKVMLKEISHARSGDKGNTVDIGLFVNNDEIYQAVLDQVTPERVKSHFEGLVEGDVFRYELPNIKALKLVCHSALNGGGASSLRLDNLGKCFGANLLRMEIELPEHLLPEIQSRGGGGI
ncbi:AtuA-related protein [Alteribacter natronophilus]|uniref:AtuA-related protein n=1 Tax=Alteribacter natronophilus TaxID=2583810 RepID=UPI00110E57C6|nr:hypothetical protein [Alteribacter natronophilus]TMW71580.1 hypothetical protein FGB90_11120 [Alteribacter natronophilus]